MDKIHQRKKFSIIKIFIFFLLGSIFGFLFEGILSYFIDGKWVNRSDLIYGPFSSLYGLGVVINLIFLLPNNNERGIFKTFFYCFIIGGLYEYLAGWLAEVLFDIKFWDYSKMVLNINGRTTMPIMIAWGIFGTILLKIFYPFISNLINKIPYKILQKTCIIFLVLIILDMFISYSAFGRMLLRNKNEYPKTFIGKICDKKYDDEFMYKKFPILKGKL